MGLSDRLKRLGEVVGGEHHADGQAELHIGDAAAPYDDWPVLRDFVDLEAARAWRQTLTEQGIESALTADHPLDEFGNGDVALRVPRDRYGDASNAFEPEV